MKIYHLFRYLTKDLKKDTCINMYVCADNKTMAREIASRFTNDKEWLNKDTIGITEFDTRSSRMITAKYKGDT